MIYRLVLSFLICSLSLPAFSQTSSKRCQWVKLTSEPVVLDSLTIVPGSITFSKAKYPQLNFTYNPNTGQFTFINLPEPAPLAPVVPDTVNLNDPPPDSVEHLTPAVLLPGLPDSVLVCYRVLPLNLALARYRRKLNAADSLRLPGVYYTESLAQKEEIFSTPGLNKPVL